MSELLIPTKSERGWVIQMSSEMAREAHAAEGSYLVIYLSESGISAEILPPATDEIKASVERSIEKFGDAFAEMKRVGD
ncbi:MAG TPA: hypothetical protein VN476_04940 [Pyrinomonadaceae bacterium]|nr:hypothetical protein [Pyrinomonadaceae bacterium]